MKVEDNFAQIPDIIQLDDFMFDFRELDSKLEFLTVDFQRCPSKKHLESMIKYITKQDKLVYKIVDKRTKKGVCWEGIQDV